MKRFLSSVIIAICFSSKLMAAVFIDHDVFYTILSEDEKTCEVMSADNNIENVIIPFYANNGDVPYRVVSIRSGAFMGNTVLKTVVIAASVTTIGDNAFANCTALNEVFNYASTPQTITDNTFTTATTATLHSLKGSRSAYKAATGWKSFPYGDDALVVRGDLNADNTVNIGDVSAVNSLAHTSGQTATTYQLRSTDLNHDGAIDGGDAELLAWQILRGTDAVTGISINQDEATIDIEEKIQLEAAVEPADCSIGVIWMSTNQSIASVSLDGLVTGVKAGTARITAMSANGNGIMATCMVTVNAKLVESVTVTPVTATIEKGKTKQLSATVLPANASTPTLKWTSSNTSIATVDQNGLVKGVGIGQATIKATSTDGSNISASSTITVKAATQTFAGFTLTAEGTKSKTLTMTVSKDQKLSFSYDLSLGKYSGYDENAWPISASTQVTVKVKNSAGKVVKTMLDKSGVKTTGTASYTFTADGKYTVEFKIIGTYYTAGTAKFTNIKVQ